MSWSPVLVGAGAMATFIAFVVLRKCLRPITVFEFEQAFRFRRGNLVARLRPGRHWVFGTVSTILKVDRRATSVTVPSQEVLSSDGVPLKVSLATRYEVVDGETALLKNQDHLSALYLALQNALRQVIATMPIEDLLKERNELNRLVQEAAAAKAQELGVRLIEIGIKDLALPGDLKKIFTQTLKARQEGQAALERARGETAALRNLANAAQMLERNPTLLQLRALQSMADAQNSSFVFGVAGPAALGIGGPAVKNGHGAPGENPTNKSTGDPDAG